MLTAQRRSGLARLPAECRTRRLLGETATNCRAREKGGGGELADRSAAFSDRFNPSSELANQMKPPEKLAPTLVIYRKKTP